MVLGVPYLKHFAPAEDSGPPSRAGLPTQSQSGCNQAGLEELWQSPSAPEKALLVINNLEKQTQQNGLALLIMESTPKSSSGHQTGWEGFGGLESTYVLHEAATQITLL